MAFCYVSAPMRHEMVVCLEARVRTRPALLTCAVLLTCAWLQACSSGGSDTQEFPPPVTPDTTAPTVPGTPTATAVSNTQINLIIYKNLIKLINLINHVGNKTSTLPLPRRPHFP